jgi:hypothetical protein
MDIDATIGFEPPGEPTRRPATVPDVATATHPALVFAAVQDVGLLTELAELVVDYAMEDMHTLFSFSQGRRAAQRPPLLLLPSGTLPVSSLCAHPAGNYVDVDRPEGDLFVLPAGTYIKSLRVQLVWVDQGGRDLSAVRAPR